MVHVPRAWSLYSHSGLTPTNSLSSWLDPSLPTNKLPSLPDVPAPPHLQPMTYPPLPASPQPTMVWRRYKGRGDAGSDFHAPHSAPMEQSISAQRLVRGAAYCLWMTGAGTESQHRNEPQGLEESVLLDSVCPRKHDIK